MNAVIAFGARRRAGRCHAHPAIAHRQRAERRRPRRSDAGQRGRASGEILPHSADPRVFGPDGRRARDKFRRGQDRVHLHRQHALAVEAAVERGEVVQGAKEQGRPAQEHQRQRDLSHDQGLPHAQPCARCRGTSAVRRLARVDAGRVQRRQDAEQEARHHRDSGREREHPRVEARLQHQAGAAVREHAHEKRDAPPGKENPGRGSERHQHRSLREHLPDQPAPAGADRQPHRDFASPRAPARQQKVRDVGAADQEHDGDDPHDDQQRLRQLPADIVQSLVRGHEHDPVEVLPGPGAQAVVGHVRLEHRVEVRARLLDCRFVLETSDDAEPPRLWRLSAVGQRNRDGHVDGKPDLQPDELRRRDTDDGDPLRADLNRLPQHRRTHAETARPQRMTDDRDVAVTAAAADVPIVGRRQHPPVRRVDAEDVEVTAGGELSPDLLLYAVDRHFEPASIEGGHAGQVPGVIAEDFVARIRRAAAAPGLAPGVVDEEESLRARDPQRLQEHRIDRG